MSVTLRYPSAQSLYTTLNHPENQHSISPFPNGIFFCPVYFTDQSAGDFGRVQLEHQQTQYLSTEESIGQQQRKSSYKSRKKREQLNSIKSEDIQGHRGKASVDELLDFIEPSKPKVSSAAGKERKKKRTTISLKRLENFHYSSASDKNQFGNKTLLLGNEDHVNETIQHSHCIMPHSDELLDSSSSESQSENTSHDMLCDNTTESMEFGSEGEFQEITKRRKKRQLLLNQSWDSISSLSASLTSQPSPIAPGVPACSFVEDEVIPAPEKSLPKMLSVREIEAKSFELFDSNKKMNTSDDLNEECIDLSPLQRNKLQSHKKFSVHPESCISRRNSNESEISLGTSPEEQLKTNSAISERRITEAAKDYFNYDNVVQFLDGSQPSNIDIEFGFEVGGEDQLGFSLVEKNLVDVSLFPFEKLETCDKSTGSFKLHDIVAYVGNKWNEVISQNCNKVAFYSDN